jgi:hypothetical protein
VSQISKKGNFWTSMKILMRLQLSKGSFHCGRRDDQTKRPDAHQCSKKCLNTSADSNHREHMFTQMSKQQLPRTLVCTGVRTANWRLWIVKIAWNRPDARARPSWRDDWRLMNKRVRPHKKKLVTACRPNTQCLGPNAAQRTLNHNCIRSSKAYI